MQKKGKKTEKERLTIMADPVINTDLIKILKSRGVTKEGLRLIRAGMMLDRSGLIDPINYILSVHKDKSDIDVLQMAIKISRVVSHGDKSFDDNSAAKTKTVKNSEQTDHKKPLSSPFSIGRKN